MNYKRLIKLLTIVLFLSLLVSKIYSPDDNEPAYMHIDNDELIEFSLKKDDSNDAIENESAVDEEVQPVFSQEGISENIFDRISGVSWKPESPVGLEDLKYITVTYLGFDNEDHVGEIIVHKKLAQEVIDIFKELYEAKFPIENIKLIDEYNANDDLSMKDNNTSAFCFREITGKNAVLSNHSYGIAIDINPVQNPYVKGDIILPSEGLEYLDRDNIRKGMIVKGDIVYKAFTKRGWIWGGNWNSPKDYQHFEKKID